MPAIDAETLAWILAAGAATGVGGLALLVVRDPSERLLDGLLGFTAGIMLAATAFSLLVPALDLGTVTEVILGFAVGGVVLLVLDRLVPHVHARFAEPGHTLDPRKRQAGLLLSALTIHNVPEGVAVGVAFAAGGSTSAFRSRWRSGSRTSPKGSRPARRSSATTAISPRPRGGDRNRRAAGGADRLRRLRGRRVVAALGLGFAAGAMLYVVVDELVPESHLRGHDRLASGALLGGFALMMALDNALG